MALLSLWGTRIPQTDMIPDLRRFRTHLYSLAGFLATPQVGFQGFGFIHALSAQDATLMVAEMFFGPSRIPNQIQDWALANHSLGGIVLSRPLLPDSSSRGYCAGCSNFGPDSIIRVKG